MASVTAYTKAQADTLLAGKDAAGAATAAQAAAVQRGNHTGTQTADTVVDGTTNKAYTAVEKTKLAGVATAATANRADSAVDTLLAAKADLVSGIIPTSQIPALALTTAVPVASRTAMLALTASQVQPGDIAIVAADPGKGSYVLTAADPSQLANWLLLNAPTDVVSSVNGQAGTVVLAATDVGAAPASLSATVSSNTTNIAGITLGGAVNAISATGTAVAGVRNTVNATAAPVTVTLPTPTIVGQRLIIERSDTSTTNTITITGTIRGVANATAVLPAVGVANEGAEWVAETLTSWAPASSIKPKAWLDAIYQKIPADVGARLGKYDSNLNTYNLGPSGLRHYRGAMGNALAGTGMCSILMIGDSVVEGHGSGQNVSVLSMPAIVTKQLALSRPKGGTGVVFTRNNGSGEADSRWAFAGTWTALAGNLFTDFVYSTAVGSTATFTSDVAGTVVEIHTYGTSSPFTYAIDGGTAATYTASGNASIEKKVITGLANTTHTVVITSTTASNTFVIGAQVRQTSGFVLANGGIGGSKASDWLDSVGFLGPGLTARTTMNPNLTLISLGYNDAVNSVTAATFSTQMQTIITAHLAAYQNDVMLVIPPYPATSSVTAAVWAAYRSVYYDLADANGLPLFDLGDRWGIYTIASGNNMMGDVIHPTGAGYAAFGLGVLNTLL